MKLIDQLRQRAVEARERGQREPDAIASARAHDQADNLAQVIEVLEDCERQMNGECPS